MIKTAAILSGGLGTRLGNLTTNTPKAMINILCRPFIEYQLMLLHKAGIKKIIFCVGHLSNQIKSHIGDGKNFGLTVEYSDDGKELLGTGGAIKKALPLLGKVFFVLYGDSYLPCNYKEIAKYFLENEKKELLALMTVFKNCNKWDKSNIVFKEGAVIAYDKTKALPEMNYIDFGLSILTEDAFKESAESCGEVFDLQSLFKDLISKSKLAGYEVFSRFYEIGSKKGIEEIEEFLLTYYSPQGKPLV